MRFLLLALVNVLLFCAEPALILHVENNALLHVSFDNRERFCQPYGITTLEMLMEQSRSNEICYNALADFYLRHPLQKHYAERLFQIRQQYMVEEFGDYCQIMVSGKRSYASLLLREGLAIVPLKFDDAFVAYGYRRLERGARNTEKGIWADPVLRNCMKMLSI